MRRQLPLILALASLPVGLAGYLAGGWLLALVAPGTVGTILMIFVPLLVAGLCMAPFLVPYLDRRAKADLAAIRTRREAEEAAPAGKPTPKR